MTASLTRTVNVSLCDTYKLAMLVTIFLSFVSRCRSVAPISNAKLWEILRTTTIAGVTMDSLPNRSTLPEKSLSFKLKTVYVDSQSKESSTCVSDAGTA